ncbi:bZIP transcription factor 44-like [Typha latifolia]|uniref:bZIP transcription factor 44-like n=1 Tax=Typha latifolia TaxID=4733 RepID=UPI003C2E7A1B
MASPSGASSGSSLFHNSGSEEDLQALMDQRKRKRMLSNRESARRSRMRKQRHLDDLMGQVNQLRKENNQIHATLSITTQNIMAVDAENSVLRTQMMELSNRLQSLNEILHFINGSNTNTNSGFISDGPQITDHNSFINPWNLVHMNQPIMASADIFQYY